MPDGTCDVCGEPRAKRIWCGKHYKRWYKYGDPLGCAQSAPLPDLPGEQWRSVGSYEGCYEISNCGRARSISRPGHPGRLLKPFPSGEYGYLAVKLCRDGVGATTYIHRLVADTFIGPLQPGQVTRHGPGGRLDNRLTNLCQGSPEDNTGDMIRDGTSLHGSRSHFAKLTEEQAADIRRRVAGGETQKSAGARYGVSQPNVSMLVRGKTWIRC